MPHNRIVVDGRTIIDQNIEEWTKAVPELQDFIHPDRKPEPWMQAILVSMAGAAVAQRPFDATVVTRSGGWTLNVETA